MKQYWTALAVALMAIFAVAGCNDYGNTFQNNTGAGLAFLSPAQMSAGSADFMLTVNGRGFVLKTVVQWNGKPLATTVPVDSVGRQARRCHDRHRESRLRRWAKRPL